MTVLAIVAAIVLGTWLSANEWRVPPSTKSSEFDIDRVTVYVPLQEFQTCTRVLEQVRIRDLNPPPES